MDPSGECSIRSYPTGVLLRRAYCVCSPPAVDDDTREYAWVCPVCGDMWEHQPAYESTRTVRYGFRNRHTRWDRYSYDFWVPLDHPAPSRAGVPTRTRRDDGDERGRLARVVPAGEPNRASRP